MGTPCVSPREACPEDTHVSLPPPLRIRACPQDTWLLTTKMGLPGAPPPVSDGSAEAQVPSVLSARMSLWATSNLFWTWLSHSE